jgi:hypothetical protein
VEEAPRESEDDEGRFIQVVMCLERRLFRDIPGWAPCETIAAVPAEAVAARMTGKRLLRSNAAAVHLPSRGSV